MYFYEILKSIMEEKKLSIPDVARLSNLTDSTIRSILSRKNKTVALEVAFKLSKGLNVPIEKLNGENLTDYNFISSSNKPIFEDDNDPLNNEILKLYSSLTDENKKYLYGYIQRLLEEQQEN